MLKFSTILLICGSVHTSPLPARELQSTTTTTANTGLFGGWQQLGLIAGGLLTASEESSIISAVNGCTADTSPLSAMLEAATAVATACTVAPNPVGFVVTDAMFDQMKECTLDSQTFFENYGYPGNMLAVPGVTENDKTVMQACAAGTVGGEVITVLMNRYTPCNLDLDTVQPLLEKLVVHDAGATAAERLLVNQNLFVIRSVCSSLAAFETINTAVSQFASQSVVVYIDSLKSLNGR